MNKASSVDMIDRKIIPANRTGQFATGALKKSVDTSTGAMLLKTPKRIAPVILAKTSSSILNGAIISLSNDRDFLSKVIVTESMDVVPNKIDIATIPGNISLISNAIPVLTNIMSIQAKGKMIPQLIFGGFK